MHFLKTDMSESACRQGSLPAMVAPKVPGYILPASRYLSFIVLFSHSVVSDSLWPHGLQHTRLP